MDLKTNWALTRELTFAQMKARYRGTLAGFVWVILSPIVMYLVQALVFRSILRIQIPNYALFLLGGLLPWSFISTSLQMGIPVFLDARQLLLAFKIQPFVLLASSVLDNWINFLAAFLFILLFLVPLTTGSRPNVWGVLGLPMAFLILLTGTGGLLACLSLLNVFYRDVRFMTQFAIGLLFFLTPIFYPPEYVPAAYRWLVMLNPFFILFDPVRECIYQFSFIELARALSKGAALALGLCALAWSQWKRRKNDFYHAL